MRQPLFAARRTQQAGVSRPWSHNRRIRCALSRTYSSVKRGSVSATNEYATSDTTSPKRK